MNVKTIVKYELGRATKALRELDAFILDDAEFLKLPEPKRAQLEQLSQALSRYIGELGG